MNEDVTAATTWPHRSAVYRFDCPNIGDGMMYPLIAKALLVLAERTQQMRANNESGEFVLNKGTVDETRVSYFWPDDDQAERPEPQAPKMFVTAVDPNFKINAVMRERQSHRRRHGGDPSVLILGEEDYRELMSCPAIMNCLVRDGDNWAFYNMRIKRTGQARDFGVQ